MRRCLPLSGQGDHCSRVCGPPSWLVCFLSRGFGEPAVESTKTQGDRAPRTPPGRHANRLPGGGRLGPVGCRASSPGRPRRLLPKRRRLRRSALDSALAGASRSPVGVSAWRPWRRRPGGSSDATRRRSARRVTRLTNAFSKRVDTTRRRPSPYTSCIATSGAFTRRSA